MSCAGKLYRYPHKIKSLHYDAIMWSSRHLQKISEMSSDGKRISWVVSANINNAFLFEKLDNVQLTIDNWVESNQIEHCQQNGWN